MNTNYNLSRRITIFQKVGFLALVMIALGSSISSRAATVNWIAASADVYTNTVDWSTGNLPAAVDTAVVGNTTISNGAILYTNNPGDPPPTNTISVLQLGGSTNSSGTFTMGSGSLTISNAGANALVPGNGTNGVGTFVMNGGTLTCLRNASTFFQDFLVVGNNSNTVGTFTLNGGTANFLCGIEIGTVGIGTINVNGGTLIDNGWFGVARGNSVTSVGQGFFNQTAGTVYILRNPGTDGGANGIAFTQNGTNAQVSISGGSLYCNCFRFAVGPGGTGRNDYETLNVSGGDIYVGGQGVIFANGAGGTHNITVNLSGGTFHDVDLAPNTGGTLGTNTVLSDGTNWTWSSSIPANINSSPGSGTVTFAANAGRTITLAASFNGSGNVALPGPGTVVISGPNGYSGTTAITGGTVMGTGTIQGTVSVSSAATIEPGAALVPGTLNIGFNSLALNACTNIIKLSGNPAVVGGGVNDLIADAGNLNLSGVTTVQIIPLAPLMSGTPYTIITYSGTPLTSAAAANFHVVSSSPRYSFSVVDPSTTPGSIQILVTGNAANLNWKGGVAGNTTNWDNTTTNWFNTGSSSLDTFFNGDAVTFNDSAVTNLVNVVGSQQPISIEFANNSKAYTITGGTLSGTVGMDGTGSVTLQTTNAPLFTSLTNNTETLILNVQNLVTYNLAATLSDTGAGQGTIIKANTNTAVLTASDNTQYHGAIIVTNGTLQYTSVNGLGAIASQLYVTNGGTLDLNGVSPGLKAMTVSGSGYNGQGAIINTSANSVQGGGGVYNLTLVGDTTFAASNRWDPDGNSNPGFNGNGFNLTMIGPGSVIITDEGETSLGNIHVTAGRLGFQGVVTMGDVTKTATMEAGTTLTFYAVNGGANPGETKNLVFNGATFDSGGNAGQSNNFNGPVLLNANSLFGTRVSLYLWGPISGSGGIALGTDTVGANGGDLYLEGTNTYGGNTTISNRTLFVGANSSLGSSPLVLVLSGGALDVTSQPTFTFNSGQILAGNGAVNGNSIVFASGSVLAPGTGGTNASALTNSGSLTLQSGSTNLVIVDKTATVTNSEVVGLTSVSIGGTLVVSNYGNALAGGDAIPLFSAGSYSGSYSQIIPATPGAGMTWNTSTLTTDGNLRVASSGPPSTPTNITYLRSGSSLTLSWPSNYTGWILQGKTNAPGIGIQGGTWVNVAGSSNTNQIVITIVPTNGPTFYRMFLP
jgi:fibronectin-binding autotransporter adhesin